MLRSTWSVFDGFEAPRSSLTWEPLESFVEAGRDYARVRCARLPDLLKTWEAHLTRWGGDPSKYEWQDFRPVRVDREEDWSDWLHYFFSSSTTGNFAFELFAPSGFRAAHECVSAQVTCEDVAEDRRADIVMRWSNGEYTQLEVKVWDLGFSKTYDTAFKLEKKYPATWTHYVLLPHERIEQWRSVARDKPLRVSWITWDDVAIALRRSLRRAEEESRWLAWAYGFCGLVEQKLLGIPAKPFHSHSLTEIVRRLRQTAILEKALSDA